MLSILRNDFASDPRVVLNRFYNEMENGEFMNRQKTNNQQGPETRLNNKKPKGKDETTKG